MRNNNHVILVTPPQAIHVTAGEHLGLGYLAAGLRQIGYNVEIIDGWLENLSSQEIACRILDSERPLFVGFSSYSSNRQSVLEIVMILRENGANFPFIAGGYAPTFHPEEFLMFGFNFVVRGEGDKVLPQLCEHLQTGFPPLSELPAVSYIDKNNMIIHNPTNSVVTDLDSLAFPARDTIRFTIFRKNPVNILSSKGCMGHCAFCSIQTYQGISNGSKWRQRSICGFVDEIEKIVSDYGVSHFKVVDDSLIEYPRNAVWCKELADELEKRSLKIRLRCSIRANRVTDEVIKELKRAGFFSFACGIENFAPTALKRMNKEATLEQNIQALNIFNKYNVYVESGIILFDDHTTLQELWQNYKFMRQYPWTVSKIFSEMYAAQNTPFTKRLQRQNLITHEANHLGNYSYPILDPTAYKTYLSLKAWNKYHIQLYDMTINPLRAVRAIKESELELFHKLYMELHERELNIFGTILQWVTDDFPLDLIEEKLDRHREATLDWYDNFEKRLKDIYLLSQLNYETKENPFA